MINLRCKVRKIEAAEPGSAKWRCRTSAKPAGRGKEEARGILATDSEGGKGVVGALRNAQSILESVLKEAPTTEAKSTA
jgi:hypothetical protein